jgi:hypothetical protein
MENSRLEAIRALAAERIAGVLDVPHSRRSLRENFYRQYGYSLRPNTFGYGNSEIAFLDWEIERGVLNPLTGERPGSMWWRKVNENLIFHSEVAFLIASEGIESPADLNVCTRHWLNYINDPSSESWYRAHNSSIIEGYLLYIEEAREESSYEQQFMNEVLIRLLYAQAMVEGTRFAFGELGELLSNPRLPSVEAIIHLPEFYPRNYPLSDTDDSNVMYLTKGFMCKLESFFDKVLISSHITRLFKLTAEWNEQPRLLHLLRDGKVVYPDCFV